MQRSARRRPRAARARIRLPCRVLIAPTAFKGTLSPSEAASIILDSIKTAHPEWVFRTLPLADGGDGTLEVLLAALGGELRTAIVQGPLGARVRAQWGLVRRAGESGPVGVIEMARASGLALLRGKNRIMDATSAGTGQLIHAALAAGCRTVLVGAGGTATADGGAGALRALGVKFFDDAGRLLDGSPAGLLRLARIDRSGMDPRLRRVRLVVLCDVTNPLLGPRGSARTFGPQKGASPREVQFIERAMRRLSAFARTGAPARPGAGAAGALAFGLAGFAGATLAQGAPLILREVGWKRAARWADLIVSGEGRVDRTTFLGKAVGEAIKNRCGAGVALLCGRNRLSAQDLARRGVRVAAEMGALGLRAPREALARAAVRLSLRFDSL